MRWHNPQGAVFCRRRQYSGENGNFSAPSPALWVCCEAPLTPNIHAPGGRSALPHSTATSKENLHARGQFLSYAAAVQHLHQRGLRGLISASSGTLWSKIIGGWGETTVGNISHSRMSLIQAHLNQDASEMVSLPMRGGGNSALAEHFCNEGLWKKATKIDIFRKTHFFKKRIKLLQTEFTMTPPRRAIPFPRT